MAQGDPLTYRAKPYRASDQRHGVFFCLEGFENNEEAIAEGNRMLRILAIGMGRNLLSDNEPPRD